MGARFAVQPMLKVEKESAWARNRSSPPCCSCSAL